MSSVTSVIREDAERIARTHRAALQPLAGTTLLVTGAGGFLGSWLLDVLAAWNAGAPRPCRVVGVDRFPGGLPERVRHLARDPHVTLEAHDMTRPLPPALGATDWMVHAAGIASPPAYRRRPLETIDVAVAGTRHVLEQARRGARGVLVLSSSEVYGDPPADAIPTPEDYRGNVSCTGPRACYDESKRLAETLCAVYARTHGVPVRVARPFNVYGPGQRLDDGRLIPDCMAAVLAGRPIVLHGDGRATRSFCYAGDAVAALLLVLLGGESGEAYNVGTDEETAVADAAELLATIAAPPRLAVEHRASEDPDYLTDNPRRRRPALGKIAAHTGWRPTVRLADGLARTVRSYREAAAAAGKPCARAS